MQSTGSHSNVRNYNSVPPQKISNRNGIYFLTLAGSLLTALVYLCITNPDKVFGR